MFLNIFGGAVALFYCAFVVECFYTSDFVSLWVIMELITLLFICYTLLVSHSRSYSSLLIYFLFQSIASMGVIFCWTLSGAGLVALSILPFFLVKLGLFPFNFWYFHGFIGLPTHSVFVGLTFQKLPPVMLLFTSGGILTFDAVLSAFLVFSLVATCVISISMALSNPGLLPLLILSSIFNGAWFIFALGLGVSVLLTYFSVYVVLTLCLLYNSKTSWQHVLFYTLMGLPPFPLFFLKFAIIWVTLLYFSAPVLVPAFWVLLVANVVMLVLYFTYYSNNVTTSLSRSGLVCC